MLKIFSIIASLKNEIGHFYEYNLSLSKAIGLNTWQHIKIIPKTCVIPNLDESWQKSIYEVENKNKLKNFKNILPFIRVFKKIKKEKDSIVFVEDFNLSILLLILISLLFVRPKTKLFLFHRFEYNITFLNGKAYKFLHFLFEKILKKENVYYLTDSNLIANLNENYFLKKFYVFPIPHNFKEISNSKKKNLNFLEISNVFIDPKNKSLSDSIKLWWPGGLIREEKGIKYIKKIVEKLKNEDNLKIIMADSARDIFSNRSDNILYVKTFLSRSEYEKLMICSDLVLLPYIGNSYKYRTSGIFVEAIAFGNIPVVTSDTWMANELKNFNLDELILDWDKDDVIKKLKIIVLDKKIKEKVDLMKNYYIKEHSIENFSLKMKQLINDKENYL